MSGVIHGVAAFEAMWFRALNAQRQCVRYVKEAETLRRELVQSRPLEMQRIRLVTLNNVINAAALN